MDVNQQSVISFIIMMVSAAIALSVARHLWSRLSVPGVLYFFWLMVSVAVFAAASAGELASLSIPAKITWGKLSYLGIVNIAPFWLLFAIRYSQKEAWLSPRRQAALWIIPLLTLVLVATNEWHGWAWTAIRPGSPEPGAWLIYTHGFGVWIFVAYSYLLLFSGSLLLVWTAWRSPQFFRWQVVALLIGAAIPWIGNLLYFLNANPWPGLDLTPISFALSAPMLTLGLFRYRAFDLTPILTDVMFESIGSGILVLDTRDRITNLNRTARQWLGLGDEVVGRDVFKATGVSQTSLRYQDGSHTKAQLVWGEGQSRRIYDLTISPLPDQQGKLQGRLVLMHDISHERVLMDAERARARQMEVLFAITQAALKTTNPQEILQVLANRLGELLQADGAFLNLWDEDSQRPLPGAAYGGLSDAYTSFTLEPGEQTMTDSVLRACQVLVAEDALNTPYLSPRIASLFSARSMLGVPLIANGRKLGAAVVAFEHPHHFTPEEVAISEQAAGQISLALAKAQLYQAEKRRVAELSALQSVSQIVSSSLELKEVFESVVKVLQSTFGYAFVSIFYLKGDCLYLGAQVGYPVDLMHKEIPLSKGILGRCVRTRQVQFVRDVTQDPDFLQASYEVGSEIAIPLLKDQEVLGAFNVESAHPLSKADQELLLAFASQVAIAINNARQYQAERDHRHLAEAFREISLAMSKNLDFDILLDHMLEEIKRVVPYDSACILLVNECGQQARVMRMADYGYPWTRDSAEIAAITFDLHQTATLSTMKETRRALIIADTAAYPGWIQTETPLPIRSWVGAPIIIQDKVAAFLSLNKAMAGFFTQEHADRLTILASQAAVAFENARLYADVQRLAIVDELTGLYNRRGFFEMGRRELDRAIRYKRPLSILFIDVDNFKMFNDAYSYAVGDQVLKLLAGCLRANTREVDLVARIMGDEFVILTPEIDMLAARKVAERVRRSIKGLAIPIDDEEVAITVSIGVCQRTLQSPDLETLVDQAGLSLHEAKQKGKDRVFMDTRLILS